MHRLKEEVSFFFALLNIINAVSAQVGTPCNEGERLINYADCTTYYICTIQEDGSTMWVVTPCPEGTIYLPKPNECVERTAYNCPDFKSQLIPQHEPSMLIEYRKLM